MIWNMAKLSRFSNNDKDICLTFQLIIFSNLCFISYRCHKPRDSLFSWNSGFDNFTGFINWAFLLLSIGGIRLLLENFLKYWSITNVLRSIFIFYYFRYGIRIDPIQWLYILTGQDESGAEHPSIVLIVCKTFEVLDPYS